MSDHQVPAPIDYVALLTTWAHYWDPDGALEEPMSVIWPGRRISAVGARVRSLATALSALREVCNGCGEPFEDRGPDGYLYNCADGDLCTECEHKRDAVVTVLTAAPGGQENG